MFNLHSKKSKKIIAAAIVIILVLAMFVSVLAYFG